MINLFIRQPFTEAGDVQKEITQEILDCICAMQNNPYPLSFLNGTEAQSASSFKDDFTKKTGIEFSVRAFRRYRLQLLDQADAFINIRTSLSESSTFELAYNIFKGKNVPVFFAVWNQSPIKTTLLQDLGDLCDIRYYNFDKQSDLEIPIKEFLKYVHDNITVSHNANSG